jgi:hypothetical protein
MSCPQCGTKLEALLFPAMTQPPRNSAPELLIAETDASCFFHPHNRAVVPCDACGRFLCGLCELEVANQRLCPECFNSGMRSRKISHFEPNRTMHDTVALTMAIVPAICREVLELAA